MSKVGLKKGTFFFHMEEAIVCYLLSHIIFFSSNQCCEIKGTDKLHKVSFKR